MGELKNLNNLHPCQTCGACCAIFRVSFLKNELSKDHAYSVPEDAVIDSSQKIVTLKGTDKQGRPACEQLIGRIGKKVGCQIYKNRPSPCRAFKASFEEGEHNIRCDKARRAHGLKPLKRTDWVNYQKILEEVP